MAKTHIQTVGRRKTAVARVILKPGKGEWSINTRSLEDYFPRPTHRQRIGQPLQAAEMEGQFDIRVKVRGGGLTGQADAVRMGLARALVEHDEDLRPICAPGDFLRGMRGKSNERNRVAPRRENGSNSRSVKNTRRRVICRSSNWD